MRIGWLGAAAAAGLFSLLAQGVTAVAADIKVFLTGASGSRALWHL